VFGFGIKTANGYGVIWLKRPVIGPNIALFQGREKHAANGHGMSMQLYFIFLHHEVLTV
jgi:hypothetical protein